MKRLRLYVTSSFDKNTTFLRLSSDSTSTFESPPKAGQPQRACLIYRRFHQITSIGRPFASVPFHTPSASPCKASYKLDHLRSNHGEYESSGNEVAWVSVISASTVLDRASTEADLGRQPLRRSLDHVGESEPGLDHAECARTHDRRSAQKGIPLPLVLHEHAHCSHTRLNTPLPQRRLPLPLNSFSPLHTPRSQSPSPIPLQKDTPNQQRYRRHQRSAHH